MDLFCTKCGEPMDNDEFHELAQELDITYTEAVRRFAREGCAAFPGNRCNVATSPERDSIFGLTAAEASGALFDILGDDTDGIAAMMDDMGF